MLRSRLALRLNCTLEELSQRMTVAEFEHWRRFDLIEPIGDMRLDKLVARLCRVVARAGGTKGLSDDFCESTWGKGLEDLSPDTFAAQQEIVKQTFKAVLAKKKVVMHA